MEREEAAWAQGQGEPSSVHTGGGGRDESGRGQKRTGFSAWSGKRSLTMWTDGGPGLGR